MIYYMNQEGRFGHQLSQLATLIAYQFAYNQEIGYKNFNINYNQYYSENRLEKILQYKKQNSIIINLIYQLLKLFGIKNISIGKYYFRLLKNENQLIFRRDIESIISTNKNLVTDCYFNDIKILLQYKSALQEICSIQFNENNPLHQQLKTLKSNYATIITIHIRKTDFKTFNNGIYFFEDEVYAKALNLLLNMLNKHCYIFICSDEAVDTTLFNTTIDYQKRNYLDDFYILQNSDYIISTRSIFSTMANFLGNNKLYQINTKSLNFTLDDFKLSEQILIETGDFS